MGDECRPVRCGPQDVVWGLLGVLVVPFGSVRCIIDASLFVLRYPVLSAITPSSTSQPSTMPPGHALLVIVRSLSAVADFFLFCCVLGWVYCSA